MGIAGTGERYVVGHLEDDPSAPVFFLSYWRPKPPTVEVGPPREVNRYVRRFFTDLTADVNELIGSVPGQDPGYLDVAATGGGRWQAQILRNAGTCQVFICLLSGPFLFNSEWCPREWDVFSRRRVFQRSDGAFTKEESAIVPVLWTPIRAEIPPDVAEVNFFSPTGLPDEDFAARYWADGMLGLLKTGQKSIYEAIVWKLALHVQKIQSMYWVEPQVPPNAEGLRTTFARRTE